ncbi:MAG: DUF4286 family protein [Bacteroidales bacterium]|jgi:hypothetical protein|nr:DUF4286 family protein [Bacteroidales bacterium]
MFIYNTTFFVDNDLIDTFLDYMKINYVPDMKTSEILPNPHLFKLLDTSDNLSGCSFSLQFSATDCPTLNNWLEERGNRLLSNLTEDFNQRILFFSTLLEEIPLKE